MRPHLFCFLATLSACRTVSPAVQSSRSDEPQPVSSVLDTPVEFVGPRGSAALPDSIGEIRIGLFGPESPDFPAGRSMLEGAQMAVEEVNAAGGIGGVPLRLVRRWDADPWRGGSKEMIKLVYQDSVWVVIGSVDGAATHVAEQVVTKAWLPLLSPVSADPTLTYIRIPWMFRLPPDDKVQVAALLRDGLRAAALSSVGLITSTDHDGRVFAEEMREQMSSARISPVFHLQLTSNNLGLGDAADRVRRFGADALVVRLPAGNVLDLLDSLRTDGIDVPVFLPWIPGLRRVDLEDRYGGSISYLSPFAVIGNQAFAAFSRSFRERFGESVTPSAAYSYDAVKLVAKSLSEVHADGLNRAAIRDAIAAASGYVGVTGPIWWDNAGGNLSQPVMLVVRDNVPDR